MFLPGMPGMPGMFLVNLNPARARGAVGRGPPLEHQNDQTTPWAEGKHPRQSPASPADEPGSSTPPPVSGVTSDDQDEGDGYSVGPDGLGVFEA